jgi:type I restriction enzyme, S subunit
MSSDAFGAYPMVKLVKFARIQPGFPFESARFTDDRDDLPLVKGENVQQGYIDWSAAKRWPASEAGELDAFVLHPGDVVVAMDRPWVQAGLKWAYVKAEDPKALLVQRVARLVAGKGLDQTYLRCLISSAYFAAYVQPIVTGVNVPHISGKQVGDFLIPMPDLAVQRKIAAILSAYDDLIANNQRRIALLEGMAEEIYREWFVRMRFPGAQRAAATTKRPFDDLCLLSRGFDLPDADMQPGDVPVVASTSIKGFHNVAKVQPPVVTTGRSGSLGTVLFVNEPAWPLNTALYVKNFRGNSPHVVYFTLRSLHLENFNAGAGVPTLNRNHLAGIRVFIPPKEIQKAFDRRVEPVLRLAEQLRDASRLLTAQRDALLPRLISGKLKVDHLDIRLPPSMQAMAAA